MISEALTLHYSFRELYALAHYVKPLEMGYMRVRLLKYDRVSVTFKPDEAAWLWQNFQHDSAPLDPFQFVVVSETCEQLNRRFNFN